ncbi:Tat (twin-arginine translocation) pathway signal sequence [Klenkia soli]|uniref:Tat (Twin-arginine translocation) pathway signal sequence n=1 Tax=Klenkia soli TaxID=1052260 RepID=A0A1H0I5T6_9ACTN|nr:twin-arginine translocation signal domain-containing protein [Klenkia soli]SDO26787.1 Tat (twin-arginine translocation) pathway signal sequence [Klenkia soli]
MSTRPAHPATTGTPTRRSFLVGVGVLPVLAVVSACTGTAPGADAVTPAQVDRLAGQVAVQQQLVAAYATAFAAAPELATAATDLADQAQAQLDRLRDAAPSVTGSPTAASSTAASPSASPSGAPRADLRAQVAAAADSHATACLEFTGARAALLGSIAAGLRGQDGLLA